jgi:hypothetical protein
MENYDIIKPATTPDFSGQTYFAVYAGSNATPTINGVSVTMAAGTILPIKVKSISATANVYLLGTNNNTIFGSTSVR